MLIESLPALPSVVLNETIEHLIANGREADCASRIRGIVESRQAGLAVLYWLYRHMDRMDAWAIPGLSSVVAEGIAAMEARGSGEALRLQNQVRKFFESPGWLEDVLRRLAAEERRSLLQRILRSPAWDEPARRSLLARIIRAHPELHALVSGTPAQEEPPPASRRLSSWRSHRERQARLRDLAERDIPENSREIAQARNYGDLRENFEYQAAKDRQKLLLRRKEELEQDLRDVRGTGFEGAVADQAGAGTRVVVARSDGARRTYCILGEWDRDEALDIISSGSAVARALEGRRAGDTVQLPAENGWEPWTVAGIAGLSDEIRAWMER
jgi:transcription elongation GreA/GreB family factor